MGGVGGVVFSCQFKSDKNSTSSKDSLIVEISEIVNSDLNTFGLTLQT